MLRHLLSRACLLVFGANAWFGLRAAPGWADGTRADSESAVVPALAAVDTMPPLENLWSEAFDLGRALSDPTREIDQVELYNGDIIVAGDFRKAGIRTVNHIARWDGSRWNPMGAGLLTRTIRAMMQYKDVFVTHDGGQVVAWDGSTWADLGPDMREGHQPLAFAAYGDSLVAAFFDIGVLSWDGANWQTIADLPIGVNGDEKVNALAVLNGDLIACGRFAELGGVDDARGTARWDGSAWHPMGQGLGVAGDRPEVVEAVVYRDTLVVRGSFRAAGGLPADGMASWDGTTWAPMPGGTAHDFWVEGDSLFALRDRAVVLRHADAWLPITADAPNLPDIHFDFVVQDGSLVVGGAFSGAHDIARWDGADWVRLSPWEGMGLDGPIAAWGVHRDTLIVAGSFTRAGSTFVGGPLGGMAKWDGARWHPFPEPIGPLAAIKSFNGDLIVGGRFGDIDGVTFNSVARWDGTAWHTMSEGFLQEWEFEGGESYVGPGRVGFLTIFHGDLIAAGGFGTGATASLSVPGNIARWDGSTWHPLDAGFDEFAGVTAVTVWEDKLIAAAKLDPFIAGIGLVSSWDGNSWTRLGSSWYASQLIVYKGDLLAGALRFGGSTFPLARWDGTFWLREDVPVGGPYATYGDQLLDRHFIGDGQTWARLGPDVGGFRFSGHVQYRGSLYVAGGFQNIGTQRSLYIGSWNGQATSVLVDAFQLHADHEGVRLEWTLAEGSLRSIRSVDVERAPRPDGPFVNVSGRSHEPARRMSFLDPSVVSGETYFYRLRIRDRQGRVIVGPALEVRVGALLPTVLHAPFVPGDGRPIEIRYRIGSGNQRVDLAVFDVRGRLVGRLVQATQRAGEHVRLWDHSLAPAPRAARGVYLVRLSAGHVIATRKLVLLHQ